MLFELGRGDPDILFFPRVRAWKDVQALLLHLPQIPMPVRHEDIFLPCVQVDDLYFPHTAFQDAGKNLLDVFLIGFEIKLARVPLVSQVEKLLAQKQHLPFYQGRGMSGYDELLLIELLRHQFSHLPG